VGCLVIIGGAGAAYEHFTGGFSWKQYAFRDGAMLVTLPFQLKAETPKPLQDESVAHGESYKDGNDALNVTISFTELKSDYEYVLKDMFAYSFAALREAKDIKVTNQKYEDFNISGYPGGKMIVDFVSESHEATMEYVYVLVGKNKCWYVCNVYPGEMSKSKKASDRIFSSIKLKE